MDFWRTEQPQQREVSSDSTPHVLPSSSTHSVFSPPLSLPVGTPGTAGTAPENGAFSRSDQALGESEHPEQHAGGEPVDWEDWPGELTWADVPSEATVAGLLAGCRFRPRKA